MSAVGLNQCCEHSVAGTDFLAMDKVEGGSMDYEGGDPEFNEGIGGQVAVERGIVTPTGNVDTMVQSLNLIALAEPASMGALPAIIEKMQGGVAPTADLARLHEDCYISRVALSCEVGKSVRASYSWKALTETEKTTIAVPVAKQTNTPIMWHGADVDIDGSPFKCQSWEAELLNEFTAMASQDTGSGLLRSPEWFDPGNFRVNLRATIREDAGLDYSANFPSTFTFKFTGVDNETVPKTFTLDLTGGDGFELQGDPIALVVGGNPVAYELSGTSLNDLTLWACTFAA